MIHVTCLAHGLQRVAETVRFTYANVNTMISSVKKVFLKAPSRLQLFREIAVGIPLPPTPIITRWETWIEAANYYTENFEVTKEVFNQLDPEESQSIKEAQSILRKKGIKEDLIFIRGNLACISVAITKLEERGLPLQESILITEEVVSSLSELKKRDFINK
ncbi:hypothetical protein RN001_005630 [Aquatica leii]|uniref:DUF659 domain-containing protein n=1 Tax=Aquatica leii TaxID=1421715 RepID=A0AAN7PHA5_9COLE|nr:hypothetical protein RN001_005630 [Aquatica leii]